jgi:hypothetical protein
VKTLLFFVMAAALPSVSVAPDAPGVVAIPCPVGQATRVLLPEALLRVKSPGANAALDVVVERTRPEGVLVLTARSYPLHAILEVRGATREFQLVIDSAAPAAAPSAATAAEAGAPPATSTPPPLEPPPPSKEDVDRLELLRAKVVVAGEREGLPGQPAMILTDALQGEHSVWLRFRLEDGAASRVARVSWEGGEVESFTQEAQGKDLRVIVRVARAEVTRRAHVSLEVEQGATYTFALGSRSLRELMR